MALPAYSSSLPQEGDDLPVTFLCSLPLIQSAIRIAGDGGARVLIDIPETEMAAIVRLVLLRGQLLRVTIEPAREGEYAT